MKEIPITQGNIAFVDDDDFDRVSRHGWCIHNLGYATARINQRGVYLHRFIVGAKKGEEVDHINKNKLDCQKSNLRICTSSQNKANRSAQSNNTTGYKGVNRWKKWFRAQCKKKTIGYFHNALDAALAYDLKAIECWGQFAELNFPKEEKCSQER